MTITTDEEIFKPGLNGPRLLLALSMSVLVVLPLALKVPMYLDDYLRAVEGVSKWSGDGRPAASFLWTLITLNAPRLSLASPLGLLLCVPAFIGSGLLLCRTLRHRQVWGPAVVVGLLFACPYFLENLSFSFDAPLMVLAVLANLAAATVLAERPRSWPLPLAMGCAVLLLVVAFSLYQAANPAFWLPVGFAALTVVQRRWSLLWQGVGCQVLALLSYRWLVLAPIDLGGYAEERGLLPSGWQLFTVVGSNLQTYGLLLKAHWLNTPSGDVFAVFFVVTFLIVCLSVGRPWITALLLMPLLVFSYGMPLLLEAPVWSPRTFIGVGVSAACLALLATRGGLSDRMASAWRRGLQFLALVVTAAALWTCLHVLYVYANAQMAQQNLNSFVVSHLTRTLNEADVDPRLVNELYVMGTAPLSPIAENSFRSVPYLRSLVRPLSHRWAGMETKLMLQERGFGTLRNRNDNTGPVRSLGSTALMDLSLQGRRLDIKFKSPESQR